jgi:glyoxylase I family protein
VRPSAITHSEAPSSPRSAKLRANASRTRAKRASARPWISVTRRMLASPREPTEDTVSLLAFREFSHVTIRVSDMERSLAFYRDGLGLRVIFDVRLDGGGLEAVTGTKGAKGRMVGLLVPGAGRVSIELLGFEEPRSERPPPGRFTGYSNISLSVDDLDLAHAVCLAHGLKPLQHPVDVGGVRMFFLADPDGTAIELIEFPRGATTSAAFNGA